MDLPLVGVGRWLIGRFEATCKHLTISRAHRRRRQPVRTTAFDRLEERRVLTSYVLPALTTSRPTADAIGTISNTNPSNSYQVDLATASVMQGNLSGLAANLDFVLKNAAGTEIAASRKSGTSVDSFATGQLASGRYTVQILRVGAAQTRYRLTLSIAGGDDLLTSATDLGTVGATTPVHSTTGLLAYAQDLQDFLRFQANANVPMRLALSGLTGDINVQVLDRNGVLITQGAAQQSAVEDVAFTPVTTGSYYLRIWTNKAISSGYRLDISMNLPGDDLFVTPLSLGTLTAEQPTVYKEGQVGAFDSPNFDLQDYYRFALTSTSPVRINMRGYAIPLSHIEVLDQLGRPIVFQQSFENRIYNLYHPAMNPGRYTLRIVQDQHSTTFWDFVMYELVVGIETNIDDFPTNATNLGTFSQATLRTVRLVDSVGDGGDKLDYYRVTFSVPTEFSISATVERGDVDVSLIRFGADNGSSGAATIYLRMSAGGPIPLAAGDYLVRIRPVRRDTPSSYVVTISADPETDDIQIRGKNVGTLVPEQRPTVVATDSVGGLDIQDFYRFSIVNPSHAFVTLGNMTSNLGIEVLDRWGRSRGTRSNSPGTTLETIALNNLAPDTYYIRIYPELGQVPSNYDLMISLRGGDDLISGAVPLGVLDGITRSSVSFSSNVGGGTDLQDFYRVTLNANLNLRIDLSGQTNVFLVQVLTTDGELIAEGRTTSTAGELSVSLPADDYVMRITSSNPLRSYQLVARVD